MALVGAFIVVLLALPTAVLLAVVLLLPLLLLYRSSAASSSEELCKEPPGPKPLPLVGNLLQLDLQRPYRSLYELSKKYGSVFTVYLGPKKVVVLAGYEAVKAAVVGYERRDFPWFKDLNPLPHGEIFLCNVTICLTEFAYVCALKNYGLPRCFLEEIILRESDHLEDMFIQHEGNPFDTTDHVNYAVSNVVAAIVYRGRLEYEDPRFKNVMSRVTQMTSFAGCATVQFYNMFPRMLHWIKNLQAIIKANENDARFMKDFLMHLKETLSMARWRGLLDAFLIRQQEELEEGNPDGLYSDEKLVPFVGNLFATGTNTSATLRWAFLFMAKYPQIQDQVQEELDRVLGRAYVSMEDRRKLPFTNAVVHETQRMVNIVPMAVPYQACRNGIFKGYIIERGTTVFSLLTSALYDESEWETPHTFNPAHFLNEEGRFIQRRAFVAFSKGCKVDLSENLGILELFLFFTSHLQRFRFTAPPGVSEDDLDLTPAEGVTSSPPPHQLCAIDRWR
uniref:Uncharacterized protein n=1 Tax=Amphiprion ocellaris TaxID=80972 RepID=A0A3Q1C8Z4_AMPOC